MSNDQAPPPPFGGVLDSGDPSLYSAQIAAEGPAGSLPFKPEDLLERPSGDNFGWTQDVAMGWSPDQLRRPQVLVLSTQGGIREPDGKPLALGYHTGHWEIGLLVRAVAADLRKQGFMPFAAHVTDPCDGRTQGTAGMMDSLPYRNDAAQVHGRLIRSLPLRAGVVGVGTCDKGLPAIMMALAAARDLPVVAIPGGVTLPPINGVDAGAVQSIGLQYTHGQLSLQEAADLGCRACATPGGGCQFLGTAATSQVVAEALGLAVTHGALAPSGQPIWTDVAVRSARAMARQLALDLRSPDVLTDSAIRNAMAVHAAFGGSTNLLLHIPAIAHAAGLRRPTIEDWIEINAQVPRLVDCLPNGPHPTVNVYLAGAVPEVMLHLRELGLLDLRALTASGESLDVVLDWWASSERRHRLRDELSTTHGIDPDDVIMSPAKASARGLTSTVAFIRGNLAPQGAIVKATAIDPSVVDADGVYRHTGPARVFTSERGAIAAIKSKGDDRVRAGEVMVLICRGPMGAGFEEVAQLTLALKYLEGAERIALLTDARFSGVSTGPCVGHIGPEALAGGPIGKLVDGDQVRIVVDRTALTGSVDLVEVERDGEARPDDDTLASRSPRADLAPDPRLPDATRLWAALQNAGGGIWGGCVYDVDEIVDALAAAPKALVDQLTAGHVDD
ncbi:MAG: YjhG/YagF family D-xylonate dehydratase [Gaiellaceae bacterium]